MAKSAVISHSEKLRLDSKYFCKAAVRARHFVKQRAVEHLGAVTSVLRKGIFDIKADTYTEPEDGVPFLRISDLKDGIINEGSTAWISEGAHRKEAATALKQGDIAISKTAYPAASLVTVDECNVSQDIIATKLSNRGKSIFYEEYVIAFLCSSLGMALMDAEFQGNVQEHFGLVDARKLPIPVLDRAFQLRVRDAFQRVIALRRQSASLVNDAETRLAAALGLADWSPPEPLAYSISSSAVRSAGRLDAEYFAPRIRELIGRLGRQRLSLGDVAPSRCERFDPTEPGGFDYIEIGDLMGDGTTSSARLARADAPSRAAWHVHPGDVVTSTVRPIRRLSALIDDSQDGFVCSSGFVVLRPESVRPEVLLTYLRLPVFCELMDLHISASMYPAISETDLLGLPFAPPDDPTETAICDAVAKARDARRRADELLESAKRAVEIAIEQNEAAALRFLGRRGADHATPTAVNLAGRWPGRVLIACPALWQSRRR